ncbi:MAG: uroporphyrinogen decarboxylase family protein [Phycisphaeraceae bacterium]
MSIATTQSRKQRVLDAVAHRQPDRIPIDFGSSFITGIHCSVVAALRDHFSLEERPVRIIEPYQMLGEVEDDLLDAMDLDVQPIFPPNTIFGFRNENWKPWTTPWKQEVLVSEHFKTVSKSDGQYIFPKGDTTAPPSGHMPATSYFFDTIIRQEPLDEAHLDPRDNIEEFSLLSDRDLAYWKAEADRLRGRGRGPGRGCDRAVLTHLNGTCLGDIALVPAPFLTHPKGVRDIATWYMTLATDPGFIKAVFEEQTRIAIGNMQRLYDVAGDVIDIVVVCGTDFGTQESTFCSPQRFDELWAPFYRRINDWIHQHTQWSTFKHSCGAVESFIPHFVDCGFDILNPVQCSARGMAPEQLKARHGQAITFWGGGVNTQQTLPFGTPDQVRAEVLHRCEVFGKGGGFVFNAIHNIQARTPIENVIAMLDAVGEFNGN